jgi:hypothetical protein
MLFFKEIIALVDHDVYKMNVCWENWEQMFCFLRNCGSRWTCSILSVVWMALFYLTCEIVCSMENKDKIYGLTSMSIS